MTATGVAPNRDRLAQLLTEAGRALDPDGVAELIAGVLAAPPEIGTSWHALVADPTPPALAEALEELRAWLAEDWRDGLAPEDFARLPRPARVALLREELAARGLDGFIVPRADEHQGEYVPACGQRLAWLTGFTGSAGMAIVLTDRAALFVDGRYTLQAAAQVDPALFEIRHLIEEPPAQWLGTALGKGAVARLRPLAAHAAGGRAAAGRRRARRGEPAPGRRQPGRPGLAGPAGGAARPGGAASRPLRRRERCRQARPARPRRSPRTGVAAAVLTMPESIAWLLNIRGGDVPHTPLPLSFAILRDDGSVTLFIDRRKLVARPRPPSRQRGQRSSRPAISARRSTRWPVIGRAGAGRPGNRGVLGVRPARGGRRRRIHRAADPCLLPKACKNRGRTRRHPRRAPPRRRRRDPLSGLAGARGAEGRIARDRRQRPARSLPPRGRAFPRPELSDDLGRRLERRDRALPRHARRARRRSNRGRSTCSIPARNISTAPPTSPARSRSARPTPRCATASPAC